jgi:hypothetical protein
MATGRMDALPQRPLRAVTRQPPAAPGRWPARQVGAQARCGRVRTLGHERSVRGRYSGALKSRDRIAALGARAPFANANPRGKPREAERCACVFHSARFVFRSRTFT